MNLATTAMSARGITASTPARILKVAVLLGLLERRPEREPLTDEDDATRPVEDEVNPKLLPFQIKRGRRTGGGNQ